MILATQTVEDFASADLLRTIVESCPTKLLLANPALDRRHYAELFQLNEMELDLLTGLIPAAADPAQTSGPGQSPHSCCRSEELLDLHQHSHRQRAGRRDVSRVRLRGGPGPSRGLCVIHGRCHMFARIARSRAGADGRLDDSRLAVRTGTGHGHSRGLCLRPQPDSAPDPPSLHDDGRAAGRRGDPRRHLRRQGLLGHQLDAQHRARQAREGRRRHEHESRDGQRRGVLVSPDREERHGACRTSRST